MPHRALLRAALAIAVVVFSAAIQPAGTPAIWAGLHAGTHGVGVARVVRDDLEVTYWYPALSGGRAMRLKDLSAKPDVFVDGLIADKMPPGLARAYGESPLFARLDAPRAAGRFPLVLVGQGNGQAAPDQAVLAEFLASHGFVVATTPSPTLRSPMKSADDVGPFAQRQAEELSRAASLLGDLGGVDVARMGVVGHSFGARAALLVAMHEPRLRAGVSLDGGIGTAQGVDSFRRAPWFDANRVTPPILHIYETSDSFMSPDFTLLRQLRGPVTLEEALGLRHVHFTTLGFKAVMDPEMARLTALGAGGPATLRNVAGRVLAFLQQHLKAATVTGRVLFDEDFERGLDRWRPVPGERFAAVDSGDPRHRNVFLMRANHAQAFALISGSDQWGSVRVEGEVLFPTDTDNYMGIVYNFREANGRADYSNIYIKGNDSYIRVNPRLDGNPLRTIYEEYQADLTGDSSIRAGHWQRFKAEIIGSMCHFYVGESQIPKVTFDFPYLKSGAVGFEPRVVGGDVWLDNIRVTAIQQFSYQGPPIPHVAYEPRQLVTEWQVLGPLAGTLPEVEREAKPSTRTYRESGRSVRWASFPTDARGAVVTAPLIDFYGPRHRAYFYANLKAEREEDVTLLFSTANELFLWLNGEFLGFIYKEDFAWHDFWNNDQHRSRRSQRAVHLRPGENHLLILVNGGNYAGGGFFLQRRGRD
jgi:dienelactone hydrolase